MMRPMPFSHYLINKKNNDILDFFNFVNEQKMNFKVSCCAHESNYLPFAGFSFICRMSINNELFIMIVYSTVL